MRAERGPERQDDAGRTGARGGGSPDPGAARAADRGRGPTTGSIAGAAIAGAGGYLRLTHAPGNRSRPRSHG